MADVGKHRERKQKIWPTKQELKDGTRELIKEIRKSSADDPRD